MAETSALCLRFTFPSARAAHHADPPCLQRMMMSLMTTTWRPQGPAAEGPGRGQQQQQTAERQRLRRLAAASGKATPQRHPLPRRQRAASGGVAGASGLGRQPLASRTSLGPSYLLAFRASLLRLELHHGSLGFRVAATGMGGGSTGFSALIPANCQHAEVCYPSWSLQGGN